MNGGVTVKTANVRANHGHLEESRKLDHLLNGGTVLQPSADIVAEPVSAADYSLAYCFCVYETVQVHTPHVVLLRQKSSE